LSSFFTGNHQKAFGVFSPIGTNNGAAIPRCLTRLPVVLWPLPLNDAATSSRANNIIFLKRIALTSSFSYGYFMDGSFIAFAIHHRLIFAPGSDDRSTLVLVKFTDGKHPRSRQAAMVQCGKPQPSRLCSETSPDSWATRACRRVRSLTVRLLDTYETGLFWSERLLGRGELCKQRDVCGPGCKFAHQQLITESLTRWPCVRGSLFIGAYDRTVP
jgi:hypothetical protein